MGANSRQKAGAMTISSAKIEKALKKSVLYMLAPQPEAWIRFFRISA
jgi:hypothetical protein